MPTASLSFVLDMYHESIDDIFTTFSENGELADVVATEAEYLDLIATLSNNEQCLAQILPMLNVDNSPEENDQIALLGLSAENDIHWKNIINQLFPLSAPYFHYIDFRWLLSRLSPSRQDEIIYFMLSDRRYATGYDDIEELIFANKMVKFYPLFINGEKRLLSYDGHCAYSLLAEMGEATELSHLFKQQKGLILQTHLAHWQLYAQDASVLDFFFEKEAFLCDSDHHFTKFASRQHLAKLQGLLSEPDDRRLTMILRKLARFGCVELIPLFVGLLPHPNPDVVYQAHAAIMAFYSPHSAIGSAATAISERIEEQQIAPQELVSFWQTIPKPDPDVRYYDGEIFDLRRMIIKNRKMPYRVELSKFIYDVSIWSGQKFAFDPYAPYKKQFEQYNQIELWFKHNPELCQSNKWLLFGQEMPG